MLYESLGHDTTLAPESYWRATCAGLDCPPLDGDQAADVAVIGGGYAGLNAALEMVERFGLRVAVLEAAQPGAGASGRNGGFCCLGGAKLSDSAIARRVGADGLAAWQGFERAAVERVRDNLARYGINAQACEEGELLLAHNARSWRTMQAAGGDLWDAAQLRARGLNTALYPGGRFTQAGFGLHPMTYAVGLARAAVAAGVQIWGGARVTHLHHSCGLWVCQTATGVVRARQVLVATNGYTDERLVPWLARRLVPVISNIMVTRPLTEAERAAQGWTRTLMSYDARHMLHYFRLLPDNRFLWGARGGLSFAAQSVADFAARARAEFDAAFPAFAGAQTEYGWNGLVCLTTSGAPYIGPVPGAKGLWVALGWHGNGVAAASEGGRCVAAAMQGNDTGLPALVRKPPPRLPIPRKLALQAGMALAGWLDGPFGAR
jgi:glycine/D-amino acid oxidase-like deaminating enzyme